MNDSSIVVVTNIEKKYGDATVLDNVSVSFEKGKIHGVIGRNGSGKTLLFKCICGLLKPDQGTIVVQGERVGKDVDIPDDIGIIIENPGFLPNYSGFKNLWYLAQIKNRISKEMVLDTIELVGLDPLSKKHTRKYSLGMKQRLGIAQALMEEPSLLILDEPMNGLDKQGLNDIRALLLKQKEEGKTILITSHSAEDIDFLCDSVHEMDKGKIERVG